VVSPSIGAVISVVMPAHNEEGYLEPAVKAVIAAMTARSHDFEVIIAQNGSVDGTRAEAGRLTTAFEEVTSIDLPDADYGQALREGFLRARGEIIVNYDVDLVDVDFLDRALEVMEDPAVAVVVGSKRSPGSDDGRAPARRLVTAAFSWVLRFGFGLRISDTHGLKALRRAPLAVLVAACRSGKDIFDTELIIRAERAGLGVEEIPVTVTDTRPPRTPIARRIPRTLAGLGRLWLLLGRPE
jgi:glycosyltransferase involved in cell wall biosynthesis